MEGNSACKNLAGENWPSEVSSLGAWSILHLHYLIPVTPVGYETVVAMNKEKECC